MTKYIPLFILNKFANHCSSLYYFSFLFPRYTSEDAAQRNEEVQYKNNHECYKNSISDMIGSSVCLVNTVCVDE